MTMFDERERAFEQMFVHDAEMRFRALARRNKLLARWAAEQLGLGGREADDYVRRAVEAVTDPDADADVPRRLATDLSAVSSYWTEDRLRQVMSEFMTKAVTEVRTEAI
ncbi:MAG TPA: DUF1476 domain-containing protein [Beijerinckiaceae bacterium]|nr:DUF1476 domain-containing protein [Beijerinckiaceae bacterium]